MRQCSQCGEWKELSDFYRRKDTPDGYRRNCKACCAVRNTKVVRKWREENRDKYLQQNRESVERWGQKYPDRQRASYRADYASHRERFYANNRKRRARKSGVEVFVITDKEIRRALESPCAHCGAPSEQLDHIVPIVRRGRHSVGNLQGLCGACNARKRDLLESERRHGRRRRATRRKSENN